MAKVSDIIFSLNATTLPSGGANANTILTALNPEYVPGLFTFSVLIFLLDLEPGKELNLSVSFIDPNGDNAAYIESPIQYEGDDSNIPQEHKGVNIGIDWKNVNLKVSGLYTLRVVVDGNTLSEKTIFVKGKNEA